MNMTTKSVDTSGVALSRTPGIPDTAGMTQDSLAPATDAAASGALIEPTIVERIDTAHPSVDDEPRKRSTVDMNRIDFNEPSGLTTQEDAVIENLEENGDA